jgi:hypothetical protein
MHPETRRTRCHPLVSLVSVFFFACAPAGEAPTDEDLLAVGTQQERLYGRTSSYWPTSTLEGITFVPVCWLTPGKDTEKHWVRQTVESQWGAYSIRFTGWGPCDASTPTYAIRILVDESNPRSYVGRTSLSPSMWLNFDFTTWSTGCNDWKDDLPGDDREYCIRGVGLHEFGHALGFFHEQDSPGNQPGTPGYCGDSVSQSQGEMLTQYDPNSTMNYCAEWSRPTLSDLDQEGLRNAYGVLPFEFRSTGARDMAACTQIVEPLDPHTWEDNYLCSSSFHGLKWSGQNALPGQRCTQIIEAADPHSWHDNYLCVPPESPVQFTWSAVGPIAGQRCTQFLEASDPNTWNDNYLCFSQRLAFSPWGRLAGYHCTQLKEASDPHFWNDNWLCSEKDEGLRFSAVGPIDGMRCTLVNEPSDPNTWHDNYVCVPNTSTLNLQWSYLGPIAGKTCVQWKEPSDPHGWHDNYLCY